MRKSERLPVSEDFAGDPFLGESFSLRKASFDVIFVFLRKTSFLHKNVFAHFVFYVIFFYVHK